MACLVGRWCGLPDTSVKEAKERVRTAIKNSGYELLSKRIIINLAPANTKKEGSVFDLPIAIGILADLGEVKNENLSEFAFLGELSLDGKLNQVNGVLPMCIEAQKLGIKTMVVPIENAKEAAIVKGIEIIGIDSLKQAVAYLNKTEKVESTKIEAEELMHQESIYQVDFAEVKGQENIKRALEIAAAGRA